MGQPNIVFILIDDLGARDLSCYGSTFYETPNLDQLASEGMKFDRAYASCPVCSPTRASIMTGKYPARVGITNYIGGKNEGRLMHQPYLHYLPLEEQSLAAALRDGGYQTWHIGKWHLGDEQFYPQHHGFDVNIGGCHWGHPTKGHFSPWQIPNLPEGEAGEFLTDHLTDQAIRLIRQRDRSRAFFLNLWHYTVHTPIQAPEHLVEKYRHKARRLKLDQIDPMIPGEDMPFISERPRRVNRRVIQSHPTYAAMVENLDTNVQRVLDVLQSEGLVDDTMVVFTSDNGGLATSEGAPTCNLPLAEGKGWTTEGGNRVCQMIRWPKHVAAGARCDTPVTSTDFYPTFLEAAGLPPRPQQHVDGISLMPLFAGDAVDREAIYWHFPHYGNQGGRPACWVVTGTWKLIEHFEDSRVDLFNLSRDPSETHECGEAHPDIRLRLHAMLKRWRNDVQAKIPPPNHHYPCRSPQVANNAHD